MFGVRAGSFAFPQNSNPTKTQKEKKKKKLSRSLIAVPVFVNLMQKTTVRCFHGPPSHK
jgi:hypothetical protein